MSLKYFNGVWQQIKNHDHKYSLSKVAKLAEEKKIDFYDLKEIRFGFNSSNPAFLLSSNNGTALFPMISPDDMQLYKSNKNSVNNMMDFWRRLDWFHPPYISRGDLQDAFLFFDISMINGCTVSDLTLQRRLGDALSTIYPVGLMVVINEQVLTETISLNKYVPVIREAILAFYSGMQIAAIALLIPIVEGVLSDLIDKPSRELSIQNKVDLAIDYAQKNVASCFFGDADWIPNEYKEKDRMIVLDERYRILEMLRLWLKNSFYCDSDKYTSYSGFNRHSFAHARSQVWQNPSNFFRAMGLLQALAFIEAFSDKGKSVNIFVPESNKHTESFHAEVLACINMQLFKKTFLQEYKINNCLPCKKTASDSGWLLRAAKLSEVMNEVIIKRLRNAGWQCYDFIDPIEDGEYISVKAKRGDSDLKVALLYSCDTRNEVYKTLDKDCEYILYNGAYYKQSSYACGVKAKVMPVNAWLAP